jgi:diguanylate cyclase (GGDEF)-like protein
MTPVNVLLVEPDEARCGLIEEMLRLLPLNIRSARDSVDAGFAVAEVPTQIVVVSDTLPDSEKLCEALRLAHEHETLHLILLVGSIDTQRLDSLLIASIDDYVDWSRGRDELFLRVRVAMRKVLKEHTMADEREYFRRAVRLEETLTSRILDENIGLKRRYEKLEEGSRTTPISGLLNFHTMQEALDAEVERSIRSYHPLAGFLFSVDNSTSLREKVGLEAMNRVMAGLGRALTTQLRKYDVAGHYYDGTIFVGLPGTDLDRAYLVANRVQSTTARTRAQSIGLGSEITMSFGVAQYRESEARDSWLHRAQAALRRAQDCGGAHIQREPKPEEYVSRYEMAI